MPPSDRLYVACAGAGVELVKELMMTPGASSYLVGISLPYATEATKDFLGFVPEKFVSEATAIYLAMESFRRSGAIGLGITASIASLVEHRGRHESYAAIVTKTDVRTIHTILIKGIGREMRETDDHFVSESAQRLLAGYGEDRTSVAMALFRGLQHVPVDSALFPGTFNPLHDGHKAIAVEVEYLTRKPVAYCVASDPPHKPALSLQDMLTRVGVFTYGTPLYIDIARRYPGQPIAIGVDALERMLDPKWGPEVEPMLTEFGTLGTKFYVAPRVIDGVARSLYDVAIPVGYRSLFIPLLIKPSTVSSTQLRQQNPASFT